MTMKGLSQSGVEVLQASAISSGIGMGVNAVVSVAKVSMRLAQTLKSVEPMRVPNPVVGRFLFR